MCDFIIWVLVSTENIIIKEETKAQDNCFDRI